MKRLRWKKVTLAIALLGGVFPSLLYGSTTPINTNWPMFMHDLHNTGYSPSDAPDSRYLLWEFDTKQRLFGSPVVYNGTVYQVGRGFLFALDSETGTVLWSLRVSVIGSTPFVTDESLYVGTCNGVAALNSQTGELIWQTQLADFKCDPWGDDRSTFLASSPIVTDKGVVMCTHRNIYARYGVPDPEGINRTVCLDPKTGALLWEYSLDERAGYSPALADGRIFINSIELEILDVETGQHLGSYFAEKGLVDTSPVISGNAIVTVSSHEGTVYMIDIDTHNLLWEYNLTNPVLSTPAVYDGRIIVVTFDGTIVTLDKSTGDILWRREIHKKVEFPAGVISRNMQAVFNSSPAIADNKVYVGLRSGLFLCLNLDTGNPLWEYQTGGAIVASPAVADGKVFIASTDGKVYCFGIDPEPPSKLTDLFLLLGFIGIVIGIIVYYVVKRKKPRNN